MKTSLSVIQIAVLVIALVSCTARTKVFTTPNSSMEPTLLQDEAFAAEMQPFQPSRGDLVIFQHEGILIVKRVIGLAGDVIEGRDMQMFVNGTAQQEQYAQHIGKASNQLARFGPVKVPQGQVFVAGDNRDLSFDSRYSAFGPVSVSDIKGRPIRVVASSNPQRVNSALR